MLSENISCFKAILMKTYSQRTDNQEIGMLRNALTGWLLLVAFFALKGHEFV